MVINNKKSLEESVLMRRIGKNTNISGYMWVIGVIIYIFFYLFGYDDFALWSSYLTVLFIGICFGFGMSYELAENTNKKSEV